MCLIVRKGTKERTAEKDIAVYKAVSRIRSNEHLCVSEFQNFLYEKDKKYSTHIEPVNLFESDYKQTYCDEQAIMAYKNDKHPLVAYSEGFHSCRYKKRALALSRYILVAKFIIPKGAKYVNDRTGLIVSDSIIFKEIINN